MRQVILPIPTQTPWFLIVGVLLCLGVAYGIWLAIGSPGEKRNLRTLPIFLAVGGVGGFFLLRFIASRAPEGIPIYGYGLMLFVTFVACTWLGGLLARREGIATEHIQDLALWIFVGGLIGSRIVFMIQYDLPLSRFLYIWEGGLVFYGGIVGAAIAYLIAYRRLVVRNWLSGWKLADIVAPCAALGLSLGRVGCLLNGCCYGDVACADCWYGVTYPLSGMPRGKLVDKGYQTAAGFTTTDLADGRSVVDLVQPGSAAEKAGLRRDDLIVGMDGQTNQIVVRLDAREKGKPDEGLLRLVQRLQTEEGVTVEEEEGRGRLSYRVAFDPGQAYLNGVQLVKEAGFVDYPTYDTFSQYLIEKWPRGKNDLQLTVQRGQEVIDLPPFQPRTLSLHATQLYETVSTGLLCLLLLAYYPFRRHDGEVMALFLILYPLHRFLNEVLRNDTEPVAFGLTLSQHGSILVAFVGLVMLLWLRRMPAQYQPWEAVDADAHAGALK